MHSSEFHLRLLIREQLLLEASEPITVQKTLNDEIIGYIDSLEYGLIGVELTTIALGTAGAIPTGGAAAGVASVVTVGTRWIGIGFNVAQIGLYLTHPDGPKWVSAGVELIELIVGIVGGAAAAKPAVQSGPKLIKAAYELIGPVTGIFKKIFNAIFGRDPTPQEEQKIKQAVTTAAGNASPAGKPPVVVNVTDVLTDMAIDDSQADKISDPSEVEQEVIQAGVPLTLVTATSEKIYKDYLAIRQGLDVYDDGTAPSSAPVVSTSRLTAVKKKIARTRPEVELAAVAEIPAQGYEFDPYDGALQYLDPRGGLQRLGDVRTMSLGTKITPALTLFRVDYDDQGKVAAVKLKNSTGKILNVKSMY